MTILISLLLSFSSFAASDCVEIIPGKSLGVMKIGDPAPAKKMGKFVVMDDKYSKDWRSAGPYHFRRNGEGKIDYIQYDPLDNKGCYNLNGKKLKPYRNLKEMKKDFPACQLDSGFGSDTLACDGMIWLLGSYLKFPEGPAFRVDVENKTLRQRQEEYARQQVHYILKQEWPYLDFRKK